MTSRDKLVYLLSLAFMCQLISTTPSENDLTNDGNPVGMVSSPKNRRAAGTNELDIYENIFLEKLIEEYGSDGVVSVSQLTELVNNIRKNVASKASEVTGHETVSNSSASPATTRGEAAGHAAENSLAGQGVTQNCTGQQKDGCQKCLSMVEIFKHHALSPEEAANGTKLQRMSPTILYQLQNPQCHVSGDHGEKKRGRPAPLAVWGYGFLCVTLINLCALMGMVFLPLMNRSFYKNMLLFMVALAVGTLTGSGVLFLIPESFEMTAPESPHADYYIWRSLTVVGGIYLFFLVERLLKMIMKSRQEEEMGIIPVKEIIYLPKNPKEKEEMQDLPIASVPTHSVHLEDSMNMSFKPVPANVQQCHNKSDRSLLHNDSSSDRLVNANGSANVGNNQLTTSHSAASSPNHHGHSHGVSLSNIRSVAWMVIFGDGLHNFIDGLSIGAAFSGSIMTGISVSLAVICEELPHELGDFAILLNSGMSMKQALSYNFLSACMCYLGLIIGILIGESTTGAVWVFAVAGGMFLYIALVDMLPEVNHAAEEEEAKTGATWSIFLLQNAGILTGIGIMVLLAVFSGKIDLSHLEE